ncbi:ribosome recycling factor-domain-containing protein [Lipomyces arxii]|uniref:ribosome recycling factor-domain-containing protein n=1 Tax=Lipomyces arxii TaxID=56418 RepID=UPI0034CE7B3A
MSIKRVSSVLTRLQLVFPRGTNHNTLLLPSRLFTTTRVSYKKKDKKSRKEEENEEEEVVEAYNPSEFKDACEKILTNARSLISDLRQGKSRLNTLKAIKFTVDTYDTKIEEQCQVSIRNGRNILVSVYDPDMLKPISSAILSAGLNMNPQPDPSNPQNLLIPIPPMTREYRDGLAKDVKHIVETARTTSVHNERQHAMQAVKKMKQASYSKDATAKLESQIEKFNKDYQTKLHKIQEEAIDAVMKA